MAQNERATLLCITGVLLSRALRAPVLADFFDPLLKYAPEHRAWVAPPSREPGEADTPQGRAPRECLRGAVLRP